MAAAQSGSDKLVHLLLAKGADCDRQEVNGYNALMIASFLGHAKICDQLLANKANVINLSIICLLIFIFYFPPTFLARSDTNQWPHCFDVCR